MLFTPSLTLRGRDEAYGEVMELFERRGLALRYRIARLLTSPTLELFGLAALLTESVREADERDGTDGEPREEAGTVAEPPELFVENGLWGYRTAQRVVVPPLYDSGFDFSEGVAAVLLGHTWHYIDTRGRVRLSCPGCEAVKPFRNGRAQVVCRGRRMEIDRHGAVCEKVPETTAG